MAARRRVATWCCVLAAALALGSAMGQDDDEELPNLAAPPGNWHEDPFPFYAQVPSYANGQLSPIDYNKKNNRIFVCEANDGPRCVMQCPDLCPKSCYNSCDDCETTCRCVHFPGTSFGDPSFTGGDGNTFYFHGRKDKDFCIVSDANLHINAHFIGNHNPANERTFTWIQALGISFGGHRLYLGARKSVEWDEEEDHIQITIDGEPINIETVSNARWVSTTLAGLSVKRTDTVNSVVVDLDGVFKISTSAVPITEKDSKIHSYGRTTKDSLVHLDLRFKFYSLTDVVDGVLGQTYRLNYINRMNVTAKMPIMGGTPKYLSSGLFSTDCAVSKFHRGNGATHVLAWAA